MVIDFKFTGLGAAVQGMNQAASSAQSMNKAFAGGGGSGSRSGGSQAGGPLASYIKSIQNLNKAVASGNSVSIFDAQVRNMRAWTAFQKAQSQLGGNGLGNFAKSFQSLVYSTRIGVGSGGVQVAPLLGKVAGMLGMLGPEAMIAAAGLMIMAQAMQAAMKYATEFGQLQLSGGGTSGQTAALAAFGAGSGLGIGAMAGLGKSYNQYLTTNPMAGGYAQSHGFGPNYVGAFGDINDSGRLLAGLKDLLFNPNEESVRRRNYGGPLENMEWMRNASPGVKAQLFKQQQVMQDPKFIQDATDAQIQLNIAMSNFQILLVSLAKNIDWKVLNYELKFLADVFEGLANHHLPDFSNLADDKAQAEMDAQNRHTDAMNNHARALDGARHTYGGDSAGPAVNSGYYSPTTPRGSRPNLGQIPLG